MKKKSTFILIILIILIDQIIKFNICNIVPKGSTIKFIGTIIQLTYVQNTGGAYSLGENNTIVIVIINIIMINALLIYFIKNFNNLKNIIKISFSLILSGGIGNLLDRIFRGHVIDYIDINNLFNYPIFNLADIVVVVGVIITIICILKDSIVKQEKI